MPEYSLILLSLALAGFVIQKAFKLKLYKSFRHLLVVNVIASIVGVSWDQFAISRGHWFFQEEFLLGPRIGHMPLEEFGFIFIVWYFGLVIYKFAEKKY